MDMGIKRGRPKGRKKEQINIRLLPEYASLLRDPSPIFWWMRKNGTILKGTDKHGKTNTLNPSAVITKMLDDTMRRIIEEDSAAFLSLDYQLQERHERPVIHSKWVRIAVNTDV